MTPRVPPWFVGLFLLVLRLSSAYQLLDDRGSQGDLDLTELIGVPLPPSVSFVTGFEGYPAYSFGPDANVGRLTKSFIPDPFHYDFAITVTAKPTTRRGGMLFAITDAYQKIVHLGIALSEVEDGSQRVVFYYTDPGTTGGTKEAASFKMGDLTGRWARFTLTVQGAEVRLYMDCEEYHRVDFARSPRPLTFEASSGIFVGNAGGTGLERFVGSIQQLVLKSDPTAPDDQCEEDDPYASGYGSGDVAYEDMEGKDEVKKITEEREYHMPFPELDPTHSSPVQAPPTEMPISHTATTTAAAAAGDDDDDNDDEDIEEISGDEMEMTTVKVRSSQTATPASVLDTVSQGQNKVQGEPGLTGPLEVPGSSSGDGDGGQPGPRGPQGPPGIPGPPGGPGKNGQTGSKGETGDPGATGFPGIPGLQGETGPKGDKGDTGFGLPGPPGPPGPPGGTNKSYMFMEGSGFEDFDSDSEIIRGPPGPPGPPGQPGLPGAASEDIVPGPPGAPGNDGKNGEPGLPVIEEWFSGSGSDFGSGSGSGQGVDGKDGDPGPAGEKGDKGEPGMSGQPGSKGEQGPPGFPGLPGSEGPEGKPGPRGPPGPAGPPGPPARGFTMDFEDLEGSGLQSGFGAVLPKGPQGPPGIPGLPGSKGADGLNGSVGNPGQKGEPGFTGRPGLKGFKGEEGPRGDKGDPGQKGEAGQDGLSLLGPPGPPGPPGPVINIQDLLLNDTDGAFNFSGIFEAQGLAGPQGPKGDIGLPGANGPPGPKGERGEPGFVVAADGSMMSGLSGPVGPKGVKGDIGITGPPGISGPVGPQGPKGEFGFPGRSGRPGLMGPKGEKGDSFGLPGPPGPPGLPGRPGILNCPKGTVFPIPPRPHCKMALNPDGSISMGNCHTGLKGEKGERGFTGISAAANADFPRGGWSTRGDQGMKGEKGDKGDVGFPGQPGLPGRPGPVGPKGESVVGPPGHPGVPGSPGIPGYGRSGPVGPPGPPGPPGLPASHSRYGSAVTIAGPPGPPGPPGPSGNSASVKTFPTRESMMQHTARDAEGTLAYVTATGSLFVKVSQGWKEIQLGSLIYLSNNIIPQDEPRVAYQIRGVTMERIQSAKERLNLVALNQPHSGDMMGLDTADRICYEQAKAMGLAPNYRAFISSNRQDLVHVVYPGFRETLPVTNLRGDVMFRNWRSIFNGEGGPINTKIPFYSFDGRDVLADPFWPQKSIWHGSSSRGLRVVDKHCETWQTNHLSVMGQSSSLTSGLLLGQQTRSCSNQYIVLCIETHKKP